MALRSDINQVTVCLLQISACLNDSKKNVQMSLMPFELKAKEVHQKSLQAASQ